MTSVFPTTPINICSLLSFGKLFVLIIPLALRWDSGDETPGTLPPWHALHLQNITRALWRELRWDTGVRATLPLSTWFFQVRCFHELLLQVPSSPQRLWHPSPPACPRRPPRPAPILHCHDNSWLVHTAGALLQLHGQSILEMLGDSVCYTWLKPKYCPWNPRFYLLI